MNGVVYFLLVGSRVKIGFSTNVKKRIEAIRTSCPGKPVLLGTIEGNRRLEASLHKEMKQFRTNGEWFKYAEEVKRKIEDITGNSMPKIAVSSLKVKKKKKEDVVEKMDVDSFLGLSKLHLIVEESKRAADLVDALSDIMPAAHSLSAIRCIKAEIDRIDAFLEEGSMPGEGNEAFCERVLTEAKLIKQKAISAAAQNGPVSLF